MPTRAVIVGLAGILSFAAAWLIAAESLRAELGFFPKDAENASAFAAAASSAGTVASIGWPRGNLASEHAVADYARGLVQKDVATAAAVKQTSLSAAHLAPYDPRPWLVLAQKESDGNRRQQILKMSYYTSPANADLFPQRFRLAAAEQIDDELRTLLEFEVGILLKQGGGFDADLEKMYRTASDSERVFLGSLLSAADPAALAKFTSRPR